MGWKSVVWVGCLIPVLAGCGAMRQDAEPRSQRAREARRDARDAWQALRDRHPDRAFSDEFRDGFLDGYADHTARAPMDAPARDYDLGFRYATDVANVNDSLSARSSVSLGKPATGATALEQPATVKPQASLLPKPEIPVIKPFNPPIPEDAGAKFAPRPVPPGPSLLPVPNPPSQAPVPRPVPPPSGLEPAPAPAPPVPRPAPTILDDIPPIPFQIPAP